MVLVLGENFEFFLAILMVTLDKTVRHIIHSGRSSGRNVVDCN